MLSQATTIHSTGLRRIPIRLLIRAFVAISTFYGFLGFYDMVSYKPWHLATLQALGRTAYVHLGLWLATLEIQSRWRYLVAVMLIPSGAGAYLLLWHHGLVTLIGATIAMILLLFRVLKGKRLEF